MPPPPFALGWVGALALTNTPPGLSVPEQFDRQMLIGPLGISAVGVSISGIPGLLNGAWVDASSSTFSAVLYPTLLVMFVARGGAIKAHAHAFVAILFLLPASIPFLLEEHVAWYGLISVIGSIVVGTLFTGVSGGAIWTAASLLVATLPLAGPRIGLPLAHGIDFSALIGQGQIYVAFSMLLVFVLLALGCFTQQRAIVEDLRAVERARAQRSLHDALPDSTADRVERDEAIADALDEVTVVFADLVGFTTIAAGLPARRLVGTLTGLLEELDAIAAEEGVEKVRTIGDCYMPVVVTRPGSRRARAALQGRECFGQAIQARIGIHSGPVTAGIIGRRRVLYDLWADTVNVASRLESTGILGEVQVSETAVRLCAQR